MSDVKAAYKEIALAVRQLCTEEYPDDLTELKPGRRVKVKGKKHQDQNSK